VGCELAQAWASLGAAVTLVEAESTLLPGEEPFAGVQLAAALRDHGVDVKLGAQATEARRAGAGAGAFTLTLAGGETITSDELLVAVGRTPHTGDLGLDTVGLEPGAPIAVDDHMRVADREWLYAIGDVNGRAQLTQAAKYQAMIAVANISQREATADWDGPLTPRVVFTDPQIAAVGQTLREALDAGIPARAVDADLGRTPGASFVGKGAPSACRIVVDERREILIGATFTGPEVAESLHAATIAIVGEVPLARLVHAMPPFPTRSEVWLRLLEPWKP
jgi:pyruvate/2-oxoglutarate dehydrogenase complex dihydrolipoamide dehydrogenase (E3) component